MPGVYQFLRNPRWIFATSAVVLLAGLFINLGFWQLRRLDDARQENQLLAARLALPPEDLAVMLEAVGEDLGAIEYHPVTVSGDFDPIGEVLLAVPNTRRCGRVPRGHSASDRRRRCVLVNRGWVPMDMDEPPVPAAPPDGRVVVEGLVRLSQERSGLGPADPGSG